MDRIRHGSQKTDRQLGFADVTVINAKGLPKMDARGLSDPYVVVLLENKDGRVVAKKRTRTIKQSLQPTWNDEFEFHVKNEEQIFHFRFVPACLRCSPSFLQSLKT